MQSGLALCSIVVESGETGGAMHQATFTKQQGRMLFTVLSNPANPKSDLNESGARILIAKFNAVPITRTAELGDELRKLSSPENRTTSKGANDGPLFDRDVVE
jgi:DNA processing protein